MTALGIDLASFQGEPDWQRVKGAGVRFAYAKASQGVNYVNPTYDPDRTGAVSHKIAFGGYHFAEARHNDPVAEADHFLSVLKPQPWHLLPCLDLEETGSEGAPPEALEEFAYRFGKHVCDRLKLRCLVLYTDRNMLEHRIKTTARLQKLYRLWLADLSSSPHPPAGWTLDLWQFNWHGHIPGIVGEVDLDRALVPLPSLTLHANGS